MGTADEKKRDLRRKNEKRERKGGREKKRESMVSKYETAMRATSWMMS